MNLICKMVFGNPLRFRIWLESKNSLRLIRLRKFFAKTHQATQVLIVNYKDLFKIVHRGEVSLESEGFCSLDIAP